MRILVVAATEVRDSAACRRGPSMVCASIVDVLVTGVGMVATAARTRPGSRAQRPTTLRFNFGVCGTFDRCVALGTVVHVTIDRLSELGAEDGERFHLHSDAARACRGRAVASSTTRRPTIRRLRELPAVDWHHRQHRPRQRATIAAVAQPAPAAGREHGGRGVCLRLRLSGVPYAQVRAVSNVVERRNRDAWQIGARHPQPQRRRRCRFSIAHEALARLLAVSQRLLHVRRDRPSAASISKDSSSTS